MADPLAAEFSLDQLEESWIGGRIYEAHRDTHKLICTECVTIVINRGHRYRSLLSAERYLLARSRNLGFRRIFGRWFAGEERGPGRS